MPKQRYLFLVPSPPHPEPSTSMEGALDRLFKTVRRLGQERRKKEEDNKLNRSKGHLWYRKEEDETDSSQ